MDEYLILNPPGTGSGFLPTQLVTYMFMHSKHDIFHLIFNMLVLWMFGSLLESTMGSKRFLKFYLIAGIAGGLFHLLMYYLGGLIGWADYTQTPSILGASAAVYGVLVGFAHYYPNYTINVYFVLPIRAKYFVSILIAIDIISSFVGTSNVAHIAHLGGALAAIIFLNFYRFKNIFRK